MEAVRPVTQPPAAVIPVRPAAAVTDAAPRPLDPAVSVALSPAAEAPTERGFERDADTRTLVYRVTDPVSGDVIVQIPDEVVLKARAYARQDTPPVGDRVATRA